MVRNIFEVLKQTFLLGRLFLTYSLFCVIVFESGWLEKLFPAGRQITERRRKRDRPVSGEIVSDEVKAARLRENLADDFIPSQYLAAKTSGITGMMKRISAEKKVLWKNVRLFCVLSPWLNLFASLRRIYISFYH